MTWIIGAAFCAGLATWALWLPGSSIQIQTFPKNGPQGLRGDGQSPGKTSPAPAIDPKLLAIKLWNAPPAPERIVESDAKPSPKPLKLQLIGIVDDADGARRAALYDLDADRLYIVASGERVGPGKSAPTVKQVLAREVTLIDGAITRRLVLVEGSTGNGGSS